LEWKSSAPGLCYVNILGKNINTIKTALLEASREVGLEINIDKTKCMVMSCHHNAG